MTLPECVNAWLQATGTKKKIVAERAGMKPSKLSEIIGGTNPDPQFSTVEKLARGFGVSVSEFLAGPRPAEDERADRPRERSAVLDQLLDRLDTEAPADDSWRGDVLKAIAALTRALRRPGTDEPARPSAKTGS